MQKPLPRVVLVGRPNVGKSTLFNRLTGRRRAIVTAVPGTTRDLIEQETSWRDTSFTLIDTAGMFGRSEDPLEKLVVAHGRRAMEDAALFVFIVDGREGLVPADREIASAIRARNRPVVLAVNKMDDRRARDSVAEFYQLGFAPVVEISSEHGQGVGDLLDEVVARLPRGEPEAAGRIRAAYGDPRLHARLGSHARQPRMGPLPREGPESGGRDLSIAVVGRPNVGKSSLVNRLLKEERMLVSEMPGTTRDAIDATFRWQKRQFRIVDTAGIRRPGRVARSGQVEAISVLSARRAIEGADVVVLVIDATEGTTDQDGAIGGAAERAGCSLVLVANKWDLVKAQGEEFSQRFDEELRYRLKFLEYAPIVHLSALTGERTPRLLEVIDRVAEARTRRVPTPQLNRFFAAATASHPPPSPGRHAIRILYAAQIGVSPPTFAVFTNVATKFHFSYERYLINRLREAFGFVGTPIRLQVRRRRREQKSRPRRA